MLVRKLAAVAVAASVALGTAGCTFMTPIATQNAYQPGDGANANIGSSTTGIAARNFVYVVNANGNGALIGTLINQGDADAKVAVSAGSVSSTVAVAAGAKVDFGYNGAPAMNLGITAAAGSTTEVTISDGSTSVKVTVPVLDATFTEYAGLVPANPTPTKP